MLESVLSELKKNMLKGFSDIGSGFASLVDSFNTSRLDVSEQYSTHKIAQDWQRVGNDLYASYVTYDSDNMRSNIDD